MPSPGARFGSGLPAGAATLAEQQTQTTALQLIDELRNALVSVALDQLRVDVLSTALGGITLKTASINAALLGDNTIVAAVGGRRIKVYAVFLNATGTVNAKWKDGAATDLTGDMNFQAREGYTGVVEPPAFLLATTAGNALILNLSAAIAVDGWVAYWDDDAS